MLLTRSIYQLVRKFIRIDSHRNWQSRVVLTTLSLPVFLIAAAEAQLPNGMTKSPAEIIKSMESPARILVDIMNKAQHAYYLEYAGFTSSVANLGVGTLAQTDNYSYSISMGNKAVFNYAISRQPNLKSFVGGVFLIGNNIQKILCEASVAGTARPANPINNNGVLACGANTALPQANQPIHTSADAKQYLRVMNIAQQAYYIERESFTSSMTNLNTGFPTETNNYSYSISTGNQAVFNYAISRQPNLKSLVGGVFVIANDTKTILCEASVAGTARPANPANNNGVLTCGANTIEISQ
ncbi:MAG: type IV pilin-like G/H family protein [Microcoleus sp.]|uniref:type IV pilin-like G/H family protein n=1 Tax=Microcoleus sp. TaxID=44472 RepID=UPI003C724759